MNTKPTPAVKPLLNKDLLGEPRHNKWNYRQAIGMLTYLQGTTRPDIFMTVHQCARYSYRRRCRWAQHRFASRLRAQNRTVAKPRATHPTTKMFMRVR